MPPVIGIDLGTTFSCAAIFEEKKGPVIITYANGKRIFPSIVYYDPKTGEVLVGRNAERVIPQCQENGLFDAKRIIGRKFDDEYISRFINSNAIPFSIVRGDNDQAAFEITISNKRVKKTPEEVSAEVLKYIKNAARVCTGEEITEAVISVPAYFSNAQRKATKKAGELAGLKVLKLITEPTAAAIYYVHDKEKKNGKVLVFDFGGGTLDVSIINIMNKQFEVKAVDGDTFLGGRNIDQILFSQYEQKILNENIIPKSIRAKTKEMLFRRLRAAVVEIKETLSENQEVTECIDCFMGKDEEYILSMSRSKFEELTEDLFENALEIVKRCLDDSGISKHDIDDVILVGGSTRIPKIHEILTTYFNKPLKTDLNPDESVAAGASIQAAVIKNKNGDFERYKITEVTPLTLGIDLFGGIMKTYIPKNSSLPYKVEKATVTAYNNQTSLTTEIFEGQRKMNKYNNLLGKFKISGFPKKRAGEITFNTCFELDEDGILKVTAFERCSGVKKNLVITMGEYRLSEKQIKLSQVEARKHKNEDDVFEKFVKLKTKVHDNCQHILYDIEKLSKVDDQKYVQQCCEKLDEEIIALDFTEIDRLEAKYAIFIKSVEDILKKNRMLQIEF